MKNPSNRHFLAADTRFTMPDVLDDQVWEISEGMIDPAAFSISTTFGLRARRMHIFPRFSLGDQHLQDTSTFHESPDVGFFSINFVSVTFFPFPFISVHFKIWVPTSNVIVGQFSVTNLDEKLNKVSVDWLVHLIPMGNGKPMDVVQIGMNTVMQGQTGTLMPVFYLTGGPEQSSTSHPGLSLALPLMPAVTRQFTWAMASLNNAEASFLLARHYSSANLDSEQLKIEMEDHKSMLLINMDEQVVNQRLRRSQVTAGQLIMPDLKPVTGESFILQRTPDNGNNPSMSRLELDFGWSGETLPDLWLLSQNLLPGRVDLVKRLVQGFIDSQTDNGVVDYRLSVNRVVSGLNAPPLLAAIVSDLHPVLNDLVWLQQIFPGLKRFLGRWLSIETMGSDPRLIMWTHPAQTGLAGRAGLSEDDQISFWFRMNEARHPFLMSLIYREVRSLIQIASWLGLKDDETELIGLQTIHKKRCEELGVFPTDPSSPMQPARKKVVKNRVVCKVKRVGEYSPMVNRYLPGRLSVRVDMEKVLPQADFMEIYGKDEHGDFCLKLNPRSFTWIGRTGLFITAQLVVELTSIKIIHWEKGNNIELRVVDLHNNDITQFLPLWAGMASPEQSDQIIAAGNLENYFGQAGLTLTACLEAQTSQRIPNFLAGMVIEGLIKANHEELALKAFKHHFFDTTDGYFDRAYLPAVENLLPVMTFLKIHGIRELSQKELVLSLTNSFSYPVTVQYNEIEVRLDVDGAEIHTRDNTTLLIKRPGQRKIIYD